MELQCGVIGTTNGNSEVVLVAGGDGGNGSLDEMETWAIGSLEETFTKLDSTLPLAMEAGSAVVTSDKKSMILVGGFSSGKSPHEQSLIIKVSCSSNVNCIAEIMDQKLRIPRWHSVAMLVPDSLAKCYEKK